jgi:hypothetical protein
LATPAPPIHGVLFRICTHSLSFVRGFREGHVVGRIKSPARESLPVVIYYFKFVRMLRYFITLTGISGAMAIEGWVDLLWGTVCMMWLPAACLEACETTNASL